MAHEFSFSDVASPSQHFCLTLPLRDFSIGHRIIFMHQRNPLVFGDEAEFNKLPDETRIFWLIESVTVCNQSYANRKLLEKGQSNWFSWIFNKLRSDFRYRRWRKEREKSQLEFTTGKKPALKRVKAVKFLILMILLCCAWKAGRFTGWLVVSGFHHHFFRGLTGWLMIAFAGWMTFQTFRLKPKIKPKESVRDLSGWWAAETAEFRNYLSASRIITDFKSRRDPFPFLPCASVPDAKGRTFGAPYEAQLIQFLIRSRLCVDTEAAMEYPFALAEMHYLTYLEREGALQIMNYDDLAHKERMAKIDLDAARKAGFQTVEEHVAFIVNQARAAKEKQADEAKSNDLASEIPAELKGTS